ncbi:MAG: hypothetical protein H0W95_05925 [Nocardioidaceae bacterium]|nr:hypothetical protein [Nocardioidaceae bacterium]
MSDGFAMSMAVRAPVERVWRALRDPAEIRRWHGWNEPGLDAEIQVIYVDHANESDDEPYTLVVDPMETFLLEPHEDETTLHLVRVPREQAGEWADHYDDITLGWVSFLHQLRFALESHPGEERRTLFWQGAGEPGDDLMAAGALPAPALGRWVTETPAGLCVDALVLGGLGSGLLVLASKRAESGGPSCQATLTTYGLDDDRWAEVRAKWTEWFRSAYPDAADPVE